MSNPLHNREEIEFLNQCEYGIVAFTEEFNAELNDFEMVVIHFVPCVNPVTDGDIREIENDLNTDEQYGMVGMINDTIFVDEAPKELVDIMKKRIKMGMYTDVVKVE